MSLVHLHLLLNHVPVVGLVGLFVLLAIAVWRRSSELGRVALALAIAVAGTAVIVFLTGEPAEQLVERLPGFDEALLERHEEAAEVATYAIVALGLLAGGLLVAYRGRALSRRALVVALAVTGGAGALTGWAASLGGVIRHTEIRAAGVGAAAAVAADRENGHERRP